jgi:hypothetical protein
MRVGLMVAGLILATTTVTLAKDAPSYDNGVLLSMASSSCGTAETGGKSVTGEILGTDGEHKTTEQLLCKEYVLQGDRIVFHIRPTDSKHPQLLPVGDNVQYRIRNGKMYAGVFRRFDADSPGHQGRKEHSIVWLRRSASVPQEELV